MVRHVVIWKLKEEYTPEQIRDCSLKIKHDLESLVGQIDGLIDLKVNNNLLEGCSGDLILESTHQDEQALRHYQKHPKHLEAASFVRANVHNRLSADFEI